MKKIFLGLTTTPGSDWREKIREIDKFGIREIAFFPTYLKKTEREEAYELLEKTNLEKIVFTHLREEDMFEDEIEYLVKRFGCNLFNIHAFRFGMKPPEHLDQFKDLIYIENSGQVEKISELANRFGGLCLDFAHWEAGVRSEQARYENFAAIVRKFKVGFAHISAIREKPVFVSWDEEKMPHYDLHKLEKLGQLDYLKNYKQYLPEILGIELENSFEEQLKIKKYLEEIVDEK